LVWVRAAILIGVLLFLFFRMEWGEDRRARSYFPAHQTPVTNA
jgi:hypothetical protein